MKKLKLGDKVKIEGTEGQILFINDQYAWLFPVSEEQEGSYFRKEHLLVGVAFAKIRLDGTLVESEA